MRAQAVLGLGRDYPEVTATLRYTKDFGCSMRQITTSHYACFILAPRVSVLPLTGPGRIGLDRPIHPTPTAGLGDVSVGGYNKGIKR